MSGVTLDIVASFSRSVQEQTESISTTITGDAIEHTESNATTEVVEEQGENIINSNNDNQNEEYDYYYQDVEDEHYQSEDDNEYDQSYEDNCDCGRNCYNYDECYHRNRKPCNCGSTYCDGDCGSLPCGCIDICRRFCEERYLDYGSDDGSYSWSRPKIKKR